ncbi:MAG: hypothetical protein JOZ98_05935 [Solirubrobacterales bacterium]|nr:hypothetical protein [Solirubrobacterales bacterium]
MNPTTGEPAPGRILCLGEALVDLICERHVDDVARAGSFVPHFGGAVSNVAVVAARYGAPTALAGGAGKDAWGRWLLDRLGREGVDVSLFTLIPGARTPLAVVAVDHHGEPSYVIYGDALATVVPALANRIEQAVRASAALFISSNTLVRAEERAVTMRARELALELRRPVLFDPNLRLHRWRSPADAADAASACVPGALLVRANVGEATLLSGEEEPERAAAALLEAGARLVVITLGQDGAILRGEAGADVPGVPADVVSTMGAGDVLTGILIARLALAEFGADAVATALPEAVAESARACERWGALE